MAFDERGSKRCWGLLRGGENRYVEFKSPDIDLRTENPGTAQVIRTLLAFGSTPGDKEGHVLLGVIENKSRKLVADDVVKVLSARYPSPPKVVEDAWKQWAHDECVQTTANQFGILIDCQINRNTAKAISRDVVIGHVKNLTLPEYVGTLAETGIEPRFYTVRYKRPVTYDGTTATTSADVCEIVIPATGPTPPTFRASKSLGPLTKGRVYRRDTGSTRDIPDEVVEWLTLRDKQAAIDKRRIRKLAWTTTLAGIFVVALGVLSQRIWQTTRGAMAAEDARQQVPPLIRTFEKGRVITFGWSDVKNAEGLRQVGGDVSLPLLLQVRAELQRRLYRAGQVDKSKPGDPLLDGGRGEVLLVAFSSGGIEQWKLEGRGYLSEAHREGELNEEMWGVQMSAPPTATPLNVRQGDTVRLTIHLQSCVNREPNSAVLFCDVALEDAKAWKATDEDETYFGRSKMTRVFVDPATLQLPADDARKLPARVHVATLFW